MEDPKVIIEQELRNIYYDPTVGYQSAKKLYQKAKEKGVSVSRRLVREYLKTQDTYTRYKPAVKNHKFQKTFVKDLADQIQLDLVDMGKYKSKNKGYYWILTGLKTMMWKYFYSKGTYNWVDALDKLTNNYNTTKHNSMFMKLADVFHSNHSNSKYKSIFSKGYEANFTEEIFKIVKVFRGDLNMYGIENHEGEPIIGKFYED